MQKFNASGCCRLFSTLSEHCKLADVASDPAFGINAATAVIPAELRQTIHAGMLVPAMNFCLESELKESRKLLLHLAKEFKDEPVTNGRFQWELLELQRLMISEMSARRFFSISEQFAQTYEDPYPMCKEVADAFPLASYDIREAYNCLVLDRHTAAVFHSMRIAEHGLRHLAKKLRVTLTHKGKSQPIDTATWEKVLGQIRSKIDAAHKLPHGARRQRQLAYYSDMGERCSYMKDLWRNDVMHSRRSYNQDEAAGALRRVSEFMNLLAAQNKRAMIGT
jgi:hypothetical protein